MIGTVWPAAFVVVPVFLVAQLRRRWSFYFVLVSVPLFHLSLFTVPGKRFNAPEVAMIGLMCHQLYYWLYHRRVVLPNKSLIWFFGFLGVGAVSIVHLAVNPASGVVNPYDGTGWIDYNLKMVEFSSKSLTQFVYRGFTVGSIVAITTAMTRRRMLVTLRWVVYSAIGVGLVGLTYQVSRLLQFYALPGAFRWFGFRKFYDTRAALGPLPRMYSPVGEPGTTSSYLLFGLAVAVAALLFCDRETVFRRSEAFGAAAALSVLLLLSTGTTGYGGLIVFSGVVGSVVLLSDHRIRRRAATTAVTIAVFAITSAVAVSLGLGLDLVSTLSYQLQKLTFEAGSGSIRFWYPKHVLPILFDRPLFGVGVGVHYSPLLWSGILVETGILGFVTFGLGNVAAYKGVLRDVVDRQLELRQPAAAVVVSGPTLIVTLALARGVTVLRYPWYWLAVGVGASYLVWSHSNRAERDTTFDTTD